MDFRDLLILNKRMILSKKVAVFEKSLIDIYNCLFMTHFNLVGIDFKNGIFQTQLNS